MKKAFDEYFKRLLIYSQKLFGTRPTVTYTDRLNQNVLVTSPDEDGEVEWIPKAQLSHVNWKDLEQELRFSVCEELREYYTLYSFLMLSGTFGNAYLNFYPIDAVEPVPQTVKRQYADGQTVFPNSQIFLIGNAIVNDDDSYFIFIDNENGKLFCYESDTSQQLLLSYSIAKTISAMEARL